MKNKTIDNIYEEECVTIYPFSSSLTNHSPVHQFQWAQHLSQSRDLLLWWPFSLSHFWRENSKMLTENMHSHTFWTIESGDQYKYMKYSRQNLIFMTPQHQFKFFDVFYSFYSFNDSLSYIMIDYEMSSSIFSRPKHCGKSGSKTLFLFNTKLLSRKMLGGDDANEWS